MPRRLPRKLRAEGGVTLVELLWAMVLGVLVFGIALMMLNFALKTEGRLGERSSSIDRGRAMMERITRELRQSSEVEEASPSRIVFDTWVDSAICGGASSRTAIECQVEYSCTSGTCTRTESDVGGTGGGPVEELVTGLLSNDVFTYSPAASGPSYVGVTLSFPATYDDDTDEDAVTLEDGVDLRNVGLD